MREIDELLRRRPGMGTLIGEAQPLGARLASEYGTRAVHPPAIRQIAEEMFRGDLHRNRIAR